MIFGFTYLFINTLQEMLNIFQRSALHTVSLACIGYLKVFLHCCGSVFCSSGFYLSPYDRVR